MDITNLKLNKNKYYEKLHLVVAILILNMANIVAQDRIFNYTYQSSVLGKGQRELEVWTTVLEGKLIISEKFKTEWNMKSVWVIIYKWLSI